MNQTVIDKSWYKRPFQITARTSAGGVVVRPQNKEVIVALVREAGLSQFLLPKGGVEEGETLEVAARREIEEEAGLTELQLIDKLGVRERLTYEKKFWNMTHYFLFRTFQISGVPTDNERRYVLTWFQIDCLPSIFWPEQKELIESNRERIIDKIRYGLDSTPNRNPHP